MINKNRIIILIFFGIFIAFFFLELALQVAGFAYSAIQKSGNISAMKQSGSCRILCLGESTTACGGDSSYPRQLEQILNEKKLGISFSVINKGIGGGSTNDILAQLEDNIAEYKPQIVITMMGINDSKNIDLIKTQSFLRFLKTYKLAKIIYRNFYDAALNDIQNVDTDLNLAVDYNRQEKALLDKIALNNKNDGILFELGINYRHQGKNRKAEIFFRKVIKLNPRHEGAYMELGDLYDVQGLHEKARNMYQKAIALTPDNANIYVKLGWVYNGQKKFDEAEKILNQAIAIEPKTYRAYIVLGRSYKDRGSFDKAEQTYKNAIELVPQKSEAYYELAWLYYCQKQEEKIDELINRAYGVNLQAKQELINIAALYYMQKEGSQSAFKNLENNGMTGLNIHNQVTFNNYNKLKEIVLQKGLILICVQYPMRNIKSLKNILRPSNGIIFVDNEKVFKDAVQQSNYGDYFNDAFGGDFGHCTKKGNRLLAENIADRIYRIKSFKAKDYIEGKE